MAVSPASVVLLLHGFTSDPRSVQPWAEALRQAGCKVHTPTLPGHGTTWQDMSATTWPQWYSAAERALLEAASEGPVTVAGLSMGGTLSLALAQRQPRLVRALMLVNPAVTVADPLAPLAPLLRLVIRSVGSIASDIAQPGVSEHAYPRTPVASVAELLGLTRSVRSRLGRVTCPVWLATSAQDHVVRPSDSDLIADRVGSERVERLALTRSFHVATLDYDASLIAEQSLRFLRSLPSPR